jgi:hypothetical protein
MRTPAMKKLVFEHYNGIFRASASDLGDRGRNRTAVADGSLGRGQRNIQAHRRRAGVAPRSSSSTAALILLTGTGLALANDAGRVRPKGSAAERRHDVDMKIIVPAFSLSLLFAGARREDFLQFLQSPEGVPPGKVFGRRRGPQKGAMNQNTPWEFEMGGNG